MSLTSELKTGLVGDVLGWIDGLGQDGSTG
jgi:hypothetical protein